MSGSADKRRLIYSIVEFLNKELEGDDISEDAKESLEVASQCLQTAYCLGLEDTHLGVSNNLETIFKSVTENEPMKKKAPPTSTEKEEAEKLKMEGNDLMRAEDFQGSIEKYTKAIEIDGSNQVFYCNRAAAHSKLGNHYAAVEDCKRAIDMDPNYGKAYGRMGLAYSNVDKHKEAIESFQKAIALEPDNESYKSNLQLAQQKLSDAGGVSAGPSAMPQGLGGMDFGSFLSNPALMNMATTMLSDPNMQSMMGQLMSGSLGGGSAPGGPAGPGGPGPNDLGGLLQAGQRLAEQMQNQNPELVEQLRRQMGGGPGDDDNPPPPPQGN